jgi:hypothetical protein
LGPDGHAVDMTVRTPAPLAAAVGLAAEAAEQLRKLPTLLVLARERYDELAEHGREVLAGHRPPPGTRVVPVEVADLAEAAVPESFGAPGGATEPVVPVEELDPRPPLGRTEPVIVPEEVRTEAAALAPGDELDSADLPLADFDHQTVPQLRGRLRTLTLPELMQLRDYEQAHGRRLPVLTLLDNRIAKLTEGP